MRKSKFTNVIIYLLVLSFVIAIIVPIITLTIN